MRESRPLSALESLHQAGIEFILVGGLAAVLNGAPVQTFDVDIVFSPSPENRTRLLEWFVSSGAIFRIQPERRIRPNEAHLAAGRPLNLLTRYGPVDLLGTVGENPGYADLLNRSNEMEIADGMRIRVLNLESVISLKEAMASEKDLAALPILRRTLREMKEKKSSL